MAEPSKLELKARLPEDAGGPWLTRYQAAAYADLSVATLDRHIRAGELVVSPDPQNLQRVRVHRSDVDALLERRASRELAGFDQLVDRLIEQIQNRPEPLPRLSPARAARLGHLIWGSGSAPPARAPSPVES